MQNSIDFQLNMLQPTLAMPTNEDHEVISYWNKRSQLCSFQQLVGQTWWWWLDMTRQSGGGAWLAGEL